VNDDVYTGVLLGEGRKKKKLTQQQTPFGILPLERRDCTSINASADSILGTSEILYTEKKKHQGNCWREREKETRAST
jgi:hypothetical protein